ncbi:MAG: hypothetical protein Fur0022_09380 [Anaerolineales bacterium]
MQKTSFSSPLLLFSLLLLLLVACGVVQQVKPVAETIPAPTLTAAPPSASPTDVPPTAPPTELPTLPPAETLVVEPSPTDAPVQPIETPSVLQIVWVNPATDILLWHETDATLTTILPASGAVDVRLSDDGALIAFRKEVGAGQQELWVVNTDGTNARMLLSVGDLQALDPSALSVLLYQYDWIPGTHTLAFNTLDYVEAPGLFLNDDLYFYDVENSQRRTIRTSGTGGNFTFSKDGKQMVLVSQNNEKGVGVISLLNTDGTNNRSAVLEYPYVLTYSEYQYYAEPVWAPDLSFLRVAIPPQDSLGDPTALTTLWEIPYRSGPSIQIGQVLAQPFFIDPVQFSPDVAHIAFTRLPDPNNYTTAELIISNADGSNEFIYATGNLFFRAWAPDSQHFIFEDGSLQETYLGVLGGAYTLLTDFPYVYDVQWIDETRFLFSVFTNSGWQLRLGTLGQASLLILESPDGNLVYAFDK